MGPSGIERRVIDEMEAIRIIEGDRLVDVINSTVFLSKFPYPYGDPIHYENGVVLWPPVDIAPTADVGENVTVGRYTNICGNVKIGKGCRIQGFCFMPEGVELGERVFVGPGVIFTNTKYPMVRDRMRPDSLKTVICDGASLGAGVVVCPGVRIGAGAMVGAGAVVSKDVSEKEVVVGNPARYLRGV